MPIVRESQIVVVGLSIIMPTTKQWGKVEVGFGFGNIFFGKLQKFYNSGIMVLF